MNDIHISPQIPPWERFAYYVISNNNLYFLLTRTGSASSPTLQLQYNDYVTEKIFPHDGTKRIS